MDRHLFPFNRTEASKLLTSPDTKASVLLAIALAAYGGEALFGDPHTGAEPWDPTMLYNQLESDFGSMLPNENENRLQGIMMALSSDAFFEEPQAFVAICGALSNGDIADAIDGSMDDLTLPEILWAGLEIELSRDDRQEYGPMVLRIIDGIAASEREDAGVEDVENMAKEPYFVQHLHEEFGELVGQYRLLGVDEKTLGLLHNLDLSNLASEPLPG
jgi:hypothetical protein